MLGKMTVAIGGKDYEIAATFRAGSLIHDRVGDPLTIMMDGAMSAINPDHKPEYSFDFVTSAKIIHAGLEASGHDLALDAIGDAFIGKRLTDLSGYAARFISLFGADDETVKAMDNVGREAGGDSGKK
jgi:hypothetical protein